MPISVLLVDDQRLFRQTLSTFLERDHEIRVVGQAADGHEAFALAMDVHPDPILMDLRLPKMDGVEATRRILERLPPDSAYRSRQSEDLPGATTPDLGEGGDLTL